MGCQGVSRRVRSRVRVWLSSREMCIWDSFRDALRWGVLSPVGLVTVDLAGVEFLCAVALTALLQAHHDAQAGGGRLVLVHPARMHQRVFAITGLDRVLTIKKP